MNHEANWPLYKALESKSSHEFKIVISQNFVALNKLILQLFNTFGHGLLRYLWILARFCSALFIVITMHALMTMHHGPALCQCCITTITVVLKNALNDTLSKRVPAVFWLWNEVFVLAKMAFATLPLFSFLFLTS